MASGKILIVDDDRNICELLRLYIEKEGFETAIANDGKAAIRMFDAVNPDLILLDGGDAHVQVGREVLEKLRLEIPIYGMVKDDFHKTRALTDGERELSIALNHGVYTFIYKIQEEAHRFAVKGTMAKKTKTLTRSSLESVPGIGPAKAKRLLAEMSLSEIRTASAGRLAAVKGISRENAEAIADYYKTKKTGDKKK